MVSMLHLLHFLTMRIIGGPPAVGGRLRSSCRKATAFRLLFCGSAIGGFLRFTASRPFDAVAAGWCGGVYTPARGFRLGNKPCASGVSRGLRFYRPIMPHGL